MRALATARLALRSPPLAAVRAAPAPRPRPMSSPPASAADGAPAVTEAQAAADPVAAAAPAPAAPAAEEGPEFLKLDVRVGRIVSIERHPDADGLYVEQVDLGEAEPRTIVSGLVKYVDIEAMQNRPVIALCNLKPRNMRGIKSDGMLLCASNADHSSVEPLDPPAGAAPGARVLLASTDPDAPPAPAGANQVAKKKVWEAVQPALATTADRAATWKGEALVVPGAGGVTCATLGGGSIS